MFLRSHLADCGIIKVGEGKSRHCDQTHDIKILKDSMDSVDARLHCLLTAFGLDCYMQAFPVERAPTNTDVAAAVLEALQSPTSQVLNPSAAEFTPAADTENCSDSTPVRIADSAKEDLMRYRGAETCTSVPPEFQHLHVLSLDDIRASSRPDPSSARLRRTVGDGMSSDRPEPALQTVHDNACREWEQASAIDIIDGTSHINLSNTTDPCFATNSPDAGFADTGSHCDQTLSEADADVDTTSRHSDCVGASRDVFSLLVPESNMQSVTTPAMASVGAAVYYDDNDPDLAHAIAMSLLTPLGQTDSGFDMAFMSEPTRPVDECLPKCTKCGGIIRGHVVEHARGKFHFGCRPTI